MEQTRLIIAIALSFMVFLIWNMFFSEKPTEPKSPADTIESPMQPQTQKTQPAGQTDLSSAPAPSAEPASAQRDALETIVKTPFYEIRISEKGAVIKSLILTQYRETIAADAPFKELLDGELNSGVLSLGFEKGRLSGYQNVFFNVDRKETLIDATQSDQRLGYTWTSQDGITIQKNFLFSPDTYMIKMQVVLVNRSEQTFSDNMTLSLEKYFPEGSGGYGFQGPSGFINQRAERVKIKKIAKQDQYPGKVNWISIQDRYFMESLIPLQPVEGRMQLFKKENNIVENRLIYPVGDIIPGTQKQIDFGIFFGPKSMAVLKTLDYDLDKAIHFGMFDILAKPCLWTLNFIYNNLVPNYGFAIIMLTILIKIILWPLGNKSYKSMSAMKKLQPLMAELREKNKNDKKKMNQELMNLYKTYKVNPMGGCLPMILQIPVFFALYRMLYETIELRHAPFFLWITDLAAPDRLFHFGFSIPFMEPPYGIPVLTIVMGATMILQQKMSPPAGDPMQAKMMMLMPVVFTFIFINFSSGLVLYWLTNNVLSIAQQYYVQKKTA